ncbi:hypothetical protein C8R47DRAFT_1326103 [Mycena vitilis]|nr:hypothetical protein C8R47DRAFT_1326103 [Mycena vitilis]
MISRSLKRKRDQPAAASPPSSPQTIPPTRGSHSRTGDDSDNRPIGSSSSPVVPNEEDDDDDLSGAEWLKKRIVEAEAGLRVLETQMNRAKNGDPEAKLFLRSMRE